VRRSLRIPNIENRPVASLRLATVTSLLGPRASVIHITYLRTGGSGDRTLTTRRGSNRAGAVTRRAGATPHVSWVTVARVDPV